MPTIREMSAAPPKRLIVRIAIAVALVLAAYLYAMHVSAREAARRDAAEKADLYLQYRRPAAALSTAFTAQNQFGTSAELTRALWASLMAGGGHHGTKALLRRTFVYAPQDPRFSLMFSADSRFLAALDGNSTTVWNVESGDRVLTTQAGDRFIGYWRIGASHFGLLASYQYYDLVNAVVSLPDTFRYAQASKDQLTAVAPGGDWAYHIPAVTTDRAEYPIKLVNLHTGEKREVDVDYSGRGPIAVNNDATLIAAHAIYGDMIEGGIWNARARSRLANLPAGQSYYISRALDAVIVIPESDVPVDSKRAVSLYRPNDGERLFELPASHPVRAIADDLRGNWFAVAVGNKIELYRGLNSPLLGLIAEREVRQPSPAAPH